MVTGQVMTTSGEPLETIPGIATSLRIGLVRASVTGSSTIKTFKRSSRAWASKTFASPSTFPSQTEGSPSVT